MTGQRRVATRSASLLTLVLFGLLAWRASAEQAGPLNDRFELTLGTFAFASDTRLRADEVDSMELGTNIDVEGELGFHDETLFRATAAWRLRPRHKLWALYFDADRRATQQIDREIEFGDETFPLGADVESIFRTRIVELAYEYVIARGDAYEVGASVGIHDVDFTVSLQTEIPLPGQPVQARVTEEVSADVPLPVFGVRGAWHLGGNLFAAAHGQYFELDIDDYAGYIQDYGASLIWQFSRHAGVGVGYNLFRSKTDIDIDSFRGRVRWDYGGVVLFVRAGF